MCIVVVRCIVCKIDWKQHSANKYEWLKECILQRMDDARWVIPPPPPPPPWNDVLDKFKTETKTSLRVLSAELRGQDSEVFTFNCEGRECGKWIVSILWQVKTVVSIAYGSPGFLCVKKNRSCVKSCCARTLEFQGHSLKWCVGVEMFSVDLLFLRHCFNRGLSNSTFDIFLFIISYMRVCTLGVLAGFLWVVLLCKCFVFVACHNASASVWT